MKQKIYKNKGQLEKTIMGKVPKAPNMVRPVFMPLKSWKIEDVLFENAKILILKAPKKLKDLCKKEESTEISTELQADIVKRAILKRTDALILSLDTEYTSPERYIDLEESLINFNEDGYIYNVNEIDTSQRKRSILSYQLSCWYQEHEERFLVFSKTESLVSLRDILSYIAPKYGIMGNKYPIKEKGPYKDKSGNTYTVPDYGKSVPVYILAYNALADVSTLEDFPEFYGTLAASTDLLSTRPYKLIYARNSAYYENFSIKSVGVQNHVPGGLKAVGQSVEIPKIELEAGWIEKMDWVRENHWNTYCEYAINDSDICLAWYLINYKHLEIPTTSPGLGAKIIEYCITKDKDPKEAKQALLQWRGLKETKEITKDRYYNEMHTKTVTEDGIGYVSDQIHNLASLCYLGGINQLCGPAGYYDVKTYDYDLQGCYATVGSMLYDVDYNQDTELDHFLNRKLSVEDAIRYPWMMWGFGTVDFEFPKNIKYPCIGKRDGNEGLIFPMKGQNYYTTWPEIKMAIMMGATIIAKSFYIFAYKKNENLQPTSVLHEAYALMIGLRSEAADLYGKKSAQAQTFKLANNGAYGKVAQNVRLKSSRAVIYNSMEDLGPSKITSPPHAAYFTAIPRILICATMQQLYNQGYHNFSVTTDGFISDACLGDLQRCDAFGLRELYENASVILRGLPGLNNDAVWEAKHEQEYLLNVTTRVNQGYMDMATGCVQDNVTVNAHTGFKNPKDEIFDSCGEKIPTEARFTYEYLNRNTNGIQTKITKLPNLNDVVWGRMDYVGTTVKTNLKMNFDFKRKIIPGSLKEVQMPFREKFYTVVNFDTEPYADYEEYRKNKDICKKLKVSLITMDDYINLTWRIDGHTNSIPDLDKQVRAAIGHLRINHRDLVNECIKCYGLDLILESLRTCITHSLIQNIDLPENYKLNPYKINWLKNTTWKHMIDRYRPEQYLGFSEWIENAMIYLLIKMQAKIETEIK